MAERRPPGFNVDLGFYDSDEVLSISRKIRAAAIGIWTLAGAFSANKLTDGHVSAEVLRTLGCTPAIRTALMATTKADGTPSPLWIDADMGAIRFTRWTKWQRTSTEVKAYRETEAERKRKAREAAKAAGANDLLQADVDATYEPPEAYVDATWTSGEPHNTDDIDRTPTPRNRGGEPSTSHNSEPSGRTSTGQSPPVRSDHRDPKTETKTETRGGYVNGVRHQGADPGDDPPPPCTRHGENYDHDEGCRRCEKRRKYDEAHAAEHARENENRKHRERMQREAAIKACRICDPFGSINMPDVFGDGDHPVKCPHDADEIERSRKDILTTKAELADQ